MLLHRPHLAALHCRCDLIIDVVVLENCILATRFFILSNTLKSSEIWISCLHAGLGMSFTEVFEKYHWKKIFVLILVLFSCYCKYRFWFKVSTLRFWKSYFDVFCGPFISYNNFCVYKFVWLFWFIFLFIKWGFVPKFVSVRYLISIICLFDFSNSFFIPKICLFDF